MLRLRYLFFLILLLVTGIGLIPPPAASGRSPEQGATPPGRQNPFGSFPLWKDVPGKHLALLREGKFKGTRWAAYVSRVGHARKYRRQPCLTLSRISSVGEYGVASGCARLVPERGRSHTLPLYRLLGIAGGSDGSEPATFLALLVAPQVNEVSIEVEPGEPITHKAQLLGRSKQKKASVAPLRYVALTVPRDVCVKRISGTGPLGEVLFDAKSPECPLPE